MPYMDSMGFDLFAKVGETLESSFFEDIKEPGTHTNLPRRFLPEKVQLRH